MGLDIHSRGLLCRDPFASVLPFRPRCSVARALCLERVGPNSCMTVYGPGQQIDMLCNSNATVSGRWYQAIIGRSESLAKCAWPIRS